MNAPASFTSYSPAGKPHITYHAEFDQGSEAWLQARCGLLTASEMKLIVTPTLKVASNDKERAHLYHLLAQRVTRYVEPHYESADMERGKFDEEHARAKYAEVYGEVTEVAGVTNNKLGFPIWYSPDGMVGDDGQIEVKSRIQKWQMQTLIEFVANDAVPTDFLIQVQTGLLVTEREWLDFVSYSGGMKMAVVRAYPDPVIQEAIANAAIDFERRLTEKLKIYTDLCASDARLVDTERLMFL